MTIVNIVMWQTRLRIVDWVHSNTQTLLATLRIQNQPREVLCIFASRTFVPISWMRNKQTSLSHSSTDSEIISLGAGLRMDGLPALDLWDVVIEVLRSTNNTARPSRLAQGNLCGTGDHSNNKTKTKTPTEKSKRDVHQLSNVDYVPTNTHSSRQEALLYVFEDKNPQSCS